MTKDEALKLALETLVDFGWHIENCPQFPTWAEPKKRPPCTCGYDTAITALHQALEEQKQDMPYGWVNENGIFAKQLPNDLVYSWKPVYAPPRKREWVGLTDEDIAEGAKQSWVDKQAFESAVWWAESKLREKNGF